MSDLHELTATEQLRALDTGEISSRDLTAHYLARIDALDGRLGAFVTVTPDQAMREAEAADARRRRGDTAPLLGLPLGVKDLYPTAGTRTTFGSAALTDHVPASDSWTVGLLRGAGVVLVGKTSTPEFGPACYTENDVTAHPAVTPYDVTRYASGSSGGAAAAVAAGLLPAAHGSDGAGSIRTPAATCHLVGVKPSRGLVSTAPTSAFFSPSTEGPLTRTVDDAALLLDVIAQPAPGDLHSWSSPSPFRAASRPVEPLRVGAWSDTGLDLPPHPEALRALHRAADCLRSLGHEVGEIGAPAAYDEATRRALQVWFATSVAASVGSAVPLEKQHLLRPYTRHLLDTAATLNARDVVQAHAALAAHASRHLAVFDRFDVVLTPTTNGPPVTLGHFFADGVQGEADRMLAWSCYTPWVNLTGQPAVSLPSHLDDDGLPHGVQLVGRPRQDHLLLALAGSLESAGLWHPNHPPCWYQ